ncbi:MAG: GTPase ObgE [Bdellovibrionales bacterium]
MKFVDEITLNLNSGKGGPGCVSFRKEAHIPRGGPDGGDGGRGGHIILRSSDRLNSLVHFQGRKKFSAPNGQPGFGSKMSGKDGEDLVLELPVGTVIKAADSGKVIVDLSRPNEEHIFLKGGIGGKGNWFYRTSVNQAPSVAQKGMPGESVNVVMELKSIADVGIIGFPNVGKSTLISVISAAKPKIADYHFTTLTPNLGVVKVSDDSSFVVADIPGLVKGAHEGTGLGIQFLRHIERTKMFLHVLDVSGMTGRDPFEDLNDINNELSMYDESSKEDSLLGTPLSERKQLVALNKVDSAPIETLNHVKRRLNEKGIEYIEISAATGQNIDKLKFKLKSWVHQIS